MQTENGKFLGFGNVEIFWQAWTPEAVKGVCLIAHGLGEHSGRYAHVAAALAERRIASFALDHRGHGKSGGKRGHLLSFDEYITDLDTFRKQVEARYPGRPVFLLGHSLGGLIAATSAERHGQGLTGVVLSSAALKVELTEPAIKLALGRVMSKIWPGLTMGNGLDPNFLSHDRQVVEAYLADPLVHDRVSARWFTEFTAAIAAVQEHARDIAVPILVMQSGDDHLVAPAGAPEFFARLTTADKTLKIWEGFYHEMFNEVEREKPLALMLSWIDKHPPG